MSDPEDDAALQHAADSAHAAWVEDEWPKGAVAMTKNLDLLTEEPLELAVALKKLAEKRVEEGVGDDEEWGAFSAAIERLVETLQGLNEPRATDTKSE